IGILIEVIAAVLVVIFAPQVAYIFTYSPDAARIYDELVVFLRITSAMFIVVPLGMLTSAMFRGVKKGVRSLIVTIMRTIFFQIPFVFLLGIVLDYGLIGIWVGIVLGNLTASVITFTWGKMTIENLFEKEEEEISKKKVVPQS
ncbi:MAG: MATE family efflux transporter, partial [Thermoplasmatota archaeon]